MTAPFVPGPQPKSIGLARVLERVGALFVPRGQAVWKIGAETVLITLVAIGTGRLVDPSDPLLVQTGFPWVWFAPVLLALRYGVLPGVTSAALLLVGWLVLNPGGIDAEIPKFHFVGGVLLTMVCGQYSGVWQMRLRRMTEHNSYLEDRIQRVTNQLYLIRLSHDRLEQNLLTRPATLRDALADLRTRVVANLPDEPMPAAQALLDFLAQQCHLEAAALYRTAPSEPSGYARVAAAGVPPPLEAKDPLLAYVREHGTVAHVQTKSLDSSVLTPHLVVAPVTAQGGEHLGVLTISQMPFIALNEDTLQMISVLLAAYADGVAGANRVLPILAALPGCTADFADELSRTLRLEREFGVDSHMTVLVFGDHPLWLDAYQLVLRQRRSPDVGWAVQSGRRSSAFVNLLPVSGPAAVEGYLVRTETALQQNFGYGYVDLAIRTFTIPLAHPDPVGELKRVIDSLD